LSKGLPSHDTFSRLFRLIEPAQFNSAFSAFLDQLGARGAGVLAIDGKTVRRSFDKSEGGSALHVVSAFASDRRLVLGQAAVASGVNEIIAARELSMLLDLTGMLVTGDAIHCQSDAFRLIVEKGGDWLFALKANHPALQPHRESVFRPSGQGHRRSACDDRRRSWPACDPPPLGQQQCRLPSFPVAAPRTNRACQDLRRWRWSRPR
jgi:hypothetical protein